MQLPIERWAEENALPEEAQVAVDESARCYKAGAYRAALVFAYISWGLSIRERILGATIPHGIPAGKWNKLQTDLRNDDTWDHELFDSIQTTGPMAVFDVPADVRHQVRYWKDRRNDCAHSKRNQVMSAHVEAFWAFMQSNLGRFVPNGSIADLLARLERHFDPNQTPPGQTLEPIVRTIPSCVPAVDLPKLMSDVQSQLSRTIGSRTIPRTMEQISFYDAIFASGQQPSILALVNHLAGQPEFFAAFTRSHPERLPFFATNASLVRELWRKYLFAGGVGELSLFAALLRNNLVPAGQIKEACERAVAGLNGDIPTAVDIPDLLRAGWVEEFRVQAFGSAKKVDEFAWGNRNAAVIQWFLMYEQISPDVAKVLCATFGSTPYPNTVRDTLRDFFASDSTKKTEFIAAAAAAGATPPPSLI